LALAVAEGGGPGGEPPAAPVAREALEDPDAGVRTAALGWLADTPVLPLEELDAALKRARRSPVLEERLGVVDALAARAEAESGERGAIVTLLETVAAEGDYPTRLRAAAALEDLGRPRPPVGPVETERPLALYRTILLQTAEPRTLAVATERGDLEIRLACPDTPLTCLSLLQLVRQRFYDGLTFHRVVPDYVVQGGDPRGDGWGGPGYTVRDELHRLRFRRGVVGLALAGPDTGGSQLFVALSPQPHLDGTYTAAGEVVSGREVLERLQPGDRILEVREVEPPRRRRP
ncbi:MAG: peptidylprolyl isomerase, partial [Thermoanaerobaculia bacterium]